MWGVSESLQEQCASWACRDDLADSEVNFSRRERKKRGGSVDCGQGIVLMTRVGASSPNLWSKTTNSSSCQSPVRRVSTPTSKISPFFPIHLNPLMNSSFSMVPLGLSCRRYLKPFNMLFFLFTIPVAGSSTTPPIAFSNSRYLSSMIGPK